RGDRMVLAADLAERVQFLRPRRSEQPVPGLGTERRDAGQPPLGIAETYRAQQPGQVAAERAHGIAMFRSGIHRHDQEDGGMREWGVDRLRHGSWHALLLAGSWTRGGQSSPR